MLASHVWNSEWPGVSSSTSGAVIGPGFSNLGNTCFLNATLQCLCYSPAFAQCLVLSAGGGYGGKFAGFVREMLERVHGVGMHSKKKVGKVGKQLDFNGGMNGNHAISPSSIVTNIRLLGKQFKIGRQEDAHEFLVHLLDALQKGELLSCGIDVRKSGWRDRLPIPRLDETTLVSRIFGGYYRSQVTCTKCNHKSNTYDPFLDLALEVSDKRVNSVEQAINNFTKKETLDKSNRWKCSGCGKLVCATKELTVFRPPLTLCIQLKRFSFGSGGGG